MPTPSRYTYRTVNRAIAARHPHMELVRGEGYHYLQFDDGQRFETHSIMCPRLCDCTVDSWVADADDFAARLAA